MIPLRVLLVEDDEDDATLVLRALERGGYAVSHHRVMDVVALREALQPGRWDLVISDFALPSFDGPSALACVKQSGIDIPFIMASGTIGEERAVEVLKAGAHDFVLKDRLARLVPAVQRELREAHLRAEQRRMREQLTISERLAAVGTLAAGLVHEINNPLLVMRANMEVIVRDMQVLQVAMATDAGAEARDTLEGLQEPLADSREALERVCEIVHDVKLFSRANDADHVAVVDVRTVIDASLRMVAADLRQSARVIREFADVPGVLANEGRLGQVFLNLVVNALHAMADDEKPEHALRIRTLTAGSGQVVVTVADDGCGIAADDVGRIFDPFFTTKPVIGTGLGLAICHGIVTELGGSIEVESKLGRGTTFTISLPPASMPPPAA